MELVSLSHNIYGAFPNYLKTQTQVFPDDYVHIGGDELKCWESNPECQQWMQDNFPNAPVVQTRTVRIELL